MITSSFLPTLTLVLVDNRVGRINMIFKEAVHIEGGSANGALVRKVCWLEGHFVVPAHMVQKFPLEHLQIQILD